MAPLKIAEAFATVLNTDHLLHALQWSRILCSDARLEIILLQFCHAMIAQGYLNQYPTLTEDCEITSQAHSSK